MESRLNFKMEGEDIILHDESVYNRDSIKNLANTFKVTLDTLDERIEKNTINNKHMEEEKGVMAARYQQILDFAKEHNIVLFDEEEDDEEREEE